MTQQWEEIEVPRGAYIGWGEHIGQHVTGKVLAYDETGGTDFNGNICPRLDVALSEPAASFDKQGARTDFAAGEFVVLNCGLVSLKRAVRAAALNTNDLVKITLVNLAKVDKGTVKEFGIKVARGAGGSSAPPAAQGQQFGGQPAAAPPAQPAQAFQSSPAPAPAQPAGDPWASAPTSPSGAEPPF